jgi:stage II sporulation protein AA (anti-sigma F factor antagonist)
MEIKEEKIGPVLILSVLGRVEMLSSPQLKEKIVHHINEGKHKLLFDLSGLDYISSPGLGVLLYTAKLLEEKKGLMHLCALKPHISEVFKICGFEKVLPIFSNREEALKTLK